MNRSRELYISLGTNQGDRERNIRRTLHLLNFYFFRRYNALSEIINTGAVGFDGPDFLNCVVKYKSRRSPEALLRAFKHIEWLMGRRDEPEYDCSGHRVFHDRIIDIDILYYGDVRMSTQELTIPHPRLKDRPFFDLLVESIRQD